MKLFLKARTINGLGGAEWNKAQYEVRTEREIELAKRNFAVKFQVELDKIIVDHVEKEI